MTMNQSNAALLSELQKKGIKILSAQPCAALDVNQPQLYELLLDHPEFRLFVTFPSYITCCAGICGQLARQINAWAPPQERAADTGTPADAPVQQPPETRHEPTETVEKSGDSLSWWTQADAAILEAAKPIAATLREALNGIPPIYGAPKISYCLGEVNGNSLYIRNQETATPMLATLLAKPPANSNVIILREILLPAQPGIDVSLAEMYHATKKGKWKASKRRFRRAQESLLAQHRFLIQEEQMRLKSGRRYTYRMETLQDGQAVLAYAGHPIPVHTSPSLAELVELQPALKDQKELKHCIFRSGINEDGTREEPQLIFKWSRKRGYWKPIPVKPPRVKPAKKK